MVSIKDKVERIIYLAQGEVVRRCHARDAGIFIADEHMSSHLKKKKRTA